MTALMDAIESHLMMRMDREAVTSFNTTSGRATRSKKRAAKVESWDEFLAWAQQNGKLDLLTRNVASRTVVEYFDSANEMPPGLSLFEAFKVSITAPK